MLGKSRLAVAVPNKFIHFQIQRKHIFFSRIKTYFLLGVFFFTLLIFLHLLLVYHASTLITKKDCFPNSNTKIFIEYLMVINFKEKLEGINICNQSLSYINISRSTFLSEANFQKTNLTNANLSSSVLVNTNFANANMANVNLHAANLANANLSKSVLVNANFTNAYMVNVNLTDTNLTNANLSSSILINTNFANANMTNVNLKGANLKDANLANALYLTNVQLNEAILCNTKLPSSIITINPNKDCSNIRVKSNHLNSTDPSRIATDLFNAARDKYKKNNFRGAIEDYNTAIRLNPNFADAYNNRGLVKSDLGDKQGAITDFSEAIRINPKRWYKENIPIADKRYRKYLEILKEENK